MKTPRPTRHADATVLGAPALAMADEDREFIDAVFETFGGQTAHIVAALRKKRRQPPPEKSA